MRTDIHSPSSIIPGDYTFLMFYHSGLRVDGMTVPSHNVKAALKVYQESGVNLHDGIFSCDVCGAWFKEGELWRHKSGEVISLGHICASTYGLYADSAEYSRKKGCAIKQAQRAAKRRKAREEMKWMLQASPGLNRALKTDHHISQDLRAKAIQYGSLSEKQIELAFKLAKDVAERAAQKAEEEGRLVEVPEGRMEVEGVVLSAQIRDGLYGSEYKMLVRVETGEGLYKLWGTIPANIESEGCWDSEGRCLGMDALKGRQVRFTATLKRSKDLGFGFYSRPAKAVLLEEK